jgi:hypothetical protein
MNNTLVETKEKTAVMKTQQDVAKKKGTINGLARRQHRNRHQQLSLVEDVKRAIDLTLEESNWAKSSSKAKGIKVLENQTIRGDSGLAWTPDLLIPGKSSSDICCAIFCIDIARQPRIEAPFDRALAACQDLDYIASIRAVIVNDDKDAYPNASRKLVSQYKRLFASNDDDIKVLDWTPMNFCDIALQILSELRGIHPNRRGIKTVDDTMLSLAQKQPDLFGEYLDQASQKTRVIELLQKIKESHPDMSFGKILGRAFASRDICELSLPFQLHRITDKGLEEMLSDFLENHK